MPTYRVGRPVGRPKGSTTPHIVLCEYCGQEMDDLANVQRGQEQFFGLTADGVAHIWPEVAPSISKHETRCTRLNR